MSSLFKGIGRADHCVIEYNGICYRQISADRVLTEQEWNDSIATTGFAIENDCECECILTTTAAPTSPSPTTTTSGATTIEGTTTTSGGTTTTSGGTTTTCAPCDERGPSPPMAPGSVNEALASPYVSTEEQLRTFTNLLTNAQFIKCLEDPISGKGRYTWFKYTGPKVERIDLLPSYPPTLTWDLVHSDYWEVAWFPEDCLCDIATTPAPITTTSTTRSPCSNIWDLPECEPADPLNFDEYCRHCIDGTVYEFSFSEFDGTMPSLDNDNWSYTECGDCDAPTTAAPDTTTTAGPSCTDCEDGFGEPETSCKWCSYINSDGCNLPFGVTCWDKNSWYSAGDCIVFGDKIYSCQSEHLTLDRNDFTDGDLWWIYIHWPDPLPEYARVGQPPNDYWLECGDAPESSSSSSFSWSQEANYDIRNLLEPIMSPLGFIFSPTTTSGPTSTTAGATSTTAGATSTTAGATSTTAGPSIGELVNSYLYDNLDNAIQIFPNAMQEVLDYANGIKDSSSISTQERLDKLRVADAYYKALGRAYTEALAHQTTTTAITTTTSAPTTTTSAP